MTPKQNENRKNIIRSQSRVVSRPDNLEGREETEIAAQISLPQDGGWGWIVVIASFLSIFILDGIVFTFGCLLPDIARDLDTDPTLIALINSISVSLYLMTGPIVSAFINRFGFRACIMTGSVICYFSLSISYFINNYGLLCAFYGIFAGLGYALINMSSGLVVGFYFQKFRAIALTITTCGSSIGVMSLNPLNSQLVAIAGWRPVTLLHSSLFGLIFFLGMTFRPLVSLTVTKTADDSAKTVVYLPNLSSISVRKEHGSSPKEYNLPPPSPTEKMFNAVTNAHFPTAANVVEDTLAALPTASQAGPSTVGAVSRITLSTQKSPGGISRLQMKQVQSVVSRLNELDKSGKGLPFELAVEVKEQEHKLSCWGRICQWEGHDSESRPMYRDDVFYEGKIENLHTYQKSVMNIAEDARTGLEYQLAVSRAATTADLKERRGVFTTAIRRVLATMMDPKLLKQGSFMCLCASGFFTYLGFLVPYVYLQDRNNSAGVDPVHCQWFISVIGLSNAFGRLILGTLTSKIDPLKMYGFACCTAGLATMCSDIMFDPYYQYIYCIIFGFFIASVACLRSIVLVNLYGLDKLTNATGMILLFQGLGSLGSTPLAGALKAQYGYRASFIVAGLFIVLSGLILFVAVKLANKEMKSQDIQADLMD